MKKIINVFIVLTILMTNSLSLLATENNGIESEYNVMEDNSTIENSEFVEEEANDTSLDLVGGDEGESDDSIDFEAPEIEDVLVEPFEVVVDGDVKLNIPEYNPIDKWAIFEHYDMNVEVNFGIENVEKKVTIKLAEGMRYVSYPVPQSMTRTDIQTPAQGVLNEMIQAIEVPTYTLWEQWNGELTYIFNSDTIGVVIPLKVTVDEFIFHTSQTLTEAIQVEASKNDVNIGVAKMNINTLGNLVTRFFSGNRLNGISVLAGENVTFRAMRRLVIGDNGRGIRYDEHPKHYSKKMTFRIYYPLGTSYVSSNYEMNKTIHDDTLGYVEFEFTNPIWSPIIDVTVSTTGVSPGTYLATNPSYNKSTMIDGTEVMTTLYPMTLGIVVRAELENKLDFAVLGDVEYFPYASDYESNGPVLRIFNNSPSIKTDQWIEIEVPNEYLATQIVFPYDRNSNDTADLKIWYETSDDIGEWKEVTSLSQVSLSAISARISMQSLALPDGITLTKIKAYIGNVGAYFESTPNSSTRSVTATTPKIVGKLKDGMTEAVFKGATYAAPLVGTEYAGTRVESNNAKVIRTNTPTTSILQQMNNVSVVAGDTQKAMLNLSSTYQYGGLTAMVNPEIYLRVPVGISYSNPQVISATGGTATISEPYITTTGEQIVKITTNNVKVGTAFGGNLDLRPRIEFDVVADLQTSGGTYQWSDYLLLKDDVSSFSNYFMHPNPQADIYDIDNDGDLTEMTVSPRFGTTLTVYPVETLTIDTYITPQGENRHPNYDGTDATSVGFTPGATANYTVDIFNNNVEPLTGFEAYIPVPKIGNNFGTNFQTGPFKWNMKLASIPTIKVVDENDVDITVSRGENYQITYSTNATMEANYNSATYSAIYNANATMIKIENTTSIPRGERAYLEFEYAIDETNSTVEANPERLDSINDFRPYYSFSAGGNIGAARGTMVGAKLVLGQISGKIFKDDNYNGIYDFGESLLGARQVDLYLKNASNVYEYVNTTTTDTNGTYDFTGIGNGLYKVDFTGSLGVNERFTQINIGSDETIDSDVEFIGVNEGAVIDVSPAAISSKTISAGIVTYEIPTIAITNGATITTQAVNAQYPNISKGLTTAITPTYFEQIKATTNTISWTSSDTGIVTVDTSGYIYGQAAGTATVTATITDTYGVTVTANIAVTVMGNSVPVITAPATLQVEYGSTYNPLVDGGVTISDAEDGPITLTNAMVVSSVPLDGSNRAMTVGTYDVMYTYTDTDSNTATTTVEVTVADTQNPSLTIGTSSIIVEAGTGILPTDWHSAFNLSATDSVDGVLLATNINVAVPGTLTSNMDVGTHTFNITATDSNGNTTTGTATVVVQDTVGPVITINGPTSKTVESGAVPLPTDWIAEFNITASDDVDGAITILSSNVQVPASLVSNTSVGQHTMVVGVGLTDGAGNSATIVTVVYEIEDTEGPEITITVPGNKITVEAGAVPLPIDWVAEFGIIASDITDGPINVLASNVQVPVTLTSNMAVGLHEFTIIVVDDEGNQATATTYYEILDTTPPAISITEPNSKTVEAGNVALPTDWLLEFGVSATDIVDGPMALTAVNTVVTIPAELMSNIVVGTHIIDISVTDTNGNTGTKLVTYIIEDTTKPIINITTATITAESGDTLPTDWVAAFGITASDIVDGPITITEVEHLEIPVLLTEITVGNHTFIITVTDANGNSEIAYATYVIQDTGSPIITFGENPIVVEAGTEVLPTSWTEWLTKFGIVVVDTTDGTIALTENDISIPVTLTSNTSVGVHTFTITVEDSSQNQASATAIYEIKDTTAPTVIIANPTVTIEAGTTLPIDWVSTFGITANDIVDGEINLTEANVQVPGTLTSDIVVGSHDFVINVTDAKNNTTTEQATLIIEDTTAPVITIANPTLVIEAGVDLLPIDWIAAFGITANDVVDGLIQVLETDVAVPSTLTSNIAVGMHTFTITVTDANNNTSNMTATAILQDQNAPQFVVVETAIVVELGSTQPTSWTDVFGVTAVDMVDGDVTTNIIYDVDPSTIDMTIEGIYVIAASVTDTTGLLANYVFIYEVEDTVAPTITVANSAIYVGIDDVKTNQELITLAVVGANDASGTEVITLDQSQVDYSVDGTYAVTVTAVDIYGNQAAATFIVEVVTLIKANNFMVNLNEIETANFVSLAGAVGWEADTDSAILTESTVTLVSSKPTTVGTYQATFETAEGVSKTVEVLVTTVSLPTPLPDTIVEHIEANDFTIDLENVTTANFVQLANAVGYEITADAVGNISFVIIPVTLASSKPAIVGAHQATFVTANGATATVNVYVTAIAITPPPAGTTAENIVASDFTIGLPNVETADFVELANAQGFVVDENLNVIETGLPVTLISSKPITIGLHAAVFTTAGGATTAVNVYITAESITSPPTGITAENVVASDFTIGLPDVEIADFVALANAQGFVIDENLNVIETGLPVTLISSKPTTIGAHTATFTTASGATATVNVYVTATSIIPPPIGTTTENIVASDFAIGLPDVEKADFVVLANAQGFVVDEDLNVVETGLPVTLISEKPTTAGLHTAVFTIAGGVTTAVNVYVTAESLVAPPAGTTAEIVIANDFAADLLTIETADFVSLADAQGFIVDENLNVIEVGLPVTLISEKPTTVGTYPTTFATVGGTTTTVNILVTDVGAYIEITANDATISLKDIQKASTDGVLESYIIEQVSATAVLHTATESIDLPIHVSTTGIENIATAVGNHSIELIVTTVSGGQALNSMQAFSQGTHTNISEYNLTESKTVNIIITEEELVDNGSNITGLTTTGEAILITLLTGMALLLAAIIVLIFVRKSQQKNYQ